MLSLLHKFSNFISFRNWNLSSVKRFHILVSFATVSKNLSNQDGLFVAKGTFLVCNIIIFINRNASDRWQDCETNKAYVINPRAGPNFLSKWIRSKRRLSQPLLNSLNYLMPFLEYYHLDIIIPGFVDLDLFITQFWKEIIDWKYYSLKGSAVKESTGRAKISCCK